MSRTKTLPILIGAAVLLAALAWMAFGFFGIHTAFTDNTVSEDNPFDAPLTSATDSTDSTDSTAQDPPEQLSMTDSPDDATTGEPGSTESSSTERSSTALTEPADTTPTGAEEASRPTIEIRATGSLIDHDHAGTGTVNVITDGIQTFLRFEDDFAVDNGPDLNVYLVRGVDAEGPPGEFDDDFIDLGDLKGNVGAQNYLLPDGVDVTEYDTVVIWCVRFGVAFNAADLA